MPSYPIRITKNDTLVGNFLSAPTQVPVSNIVTLAVEYYVTVGEYLHIGTATTNETELLGKKKSIYIPNDSPAAAFLSKEKEYKKVMCRILEGGISIAEENSVISRAEYLLALKELHSRQDSRHGISMMPVRKEMEVIAEIPQEKQTEPVINELVQTVKKTAETEPEPTGGGLEFAFGFIKGVENLDKD